MLKYCCYLLIFLSCIEFARSEKILFIACSPAHSHQKPFQVIWKALSLRGHDVHVLTPNPLKDPTLVNLTEYDLSSFYKDREKSAQKNKDLFNYMIKKPDFLTVFLKDSIMTKIWSNLFYRCLTHNETRRLIENNKHFDAVLVEWLFPTMAAFGAYYKAPIIGVSSLGAPSVALDTLGNPSHPLVSPDYNLPLTRDMTFRERLMAVLYAVYVKLYYDMAVLPREDAQIKKYLSPDLPYLGDIEKNISVLLLNRNPVFHRIMPFNPTTIDLGGIKYSTVKQEIQPDLKKFIESSKEGTILFSLGSYVKSDFLPNNTIEAVKKVFKSLPYNFVWKWGEEDMEGKPENVFISNWIPQVAVLEHPNVKLFITHGGLQSLEETIAAHKPIIGIPFQSDGTSNVDTCVKYGMGKTLELEDITYENLREYILEIMGDPSYAKNAKNLDTLMKDQPQDGLEKAIWWTEYVIRHKGAKHLKSIAVDLPWWKTLLLDIISLILFIITITLFGLYMICRMIVHLLGRIVRKICFNSSKVKSKTKKSKKE
uniref:UDP-glucuronosyltransferase 40AH1 n=1 Tax=Lissorhoptrus oryzophilus TaxID=308863 RepID=A0A2R4FXE5_9CUCU|nr:UDP-glucuronosyltransferase 40AH1 [Lissorhoptrus oryzophilus]